MNVFKQVKLFGGSFISLAEALEYEGPKTVVFIGVPGQSRKGTDPELIHPWFVLFCVSTFSLPRSVEHFALSRIEADYITNIWDCVSESELAPHTGEADEEDLLADLLA